MNNIQEMVETVNKDIKVATKNQFCLSLNQQEEMRLTGRTCFPLRLIVPYLKQINLFLNANHKECIWNVSLNIISTDIEITFSNIQMTI